MTLVNKDGVSKEWTCPECGEHEIEEDISNVTEVAPVCSIGDGGDVEYGDTVSHGGSTSHYSCTDCCHILGSTIGPEEDEKLTSAEELYKFLLKEVFGEE